MKFYDELQMRNRYCRKEELQAVFMSMKMKDLFFWVQYFMMKVMYLTCLKSYIY